MTQTPKSELAPDSEDIQLSSLSELALAFNRLAVAVECKFPRPISYNIT